MKGQLRFDCGHHGQACRPVLRGEAGKQRRPGLRPQIPRSSGPQQSPQRTRRAAKSRLREGDHPLSGVGADTRHEATLKGDGHVHGKSTPTSPSRIRGRSTPLSSFQTQLGGGTGGHHFRGLQVGQRPHRPGRTVRGYEQLTDQIDMSGFDMDFAKICPDRDDYLIGLPVGNQQHGDTCITWNF